MYYPDELIEEVRLKNDIVDVVSGYVKIQKKGSSYFGLCPFHNEKSPSFSVSPGKQMFYCFGCGATGDVIDLVARLFNLSSYDAAKKLAYDFGIDPDKPPAAAALRKPKYPLAKAFQNETLHCQRILCDYLHLLERWKVQCAPKTPDNLRAPAETQQSGFGGKRTSSEMSELSPQGGSEGYGACEDVDDRFVEACQMLDYIEDLTDILTFAELEVRVKTVDMLQKDGMIDRLEERLKRTAKEVDARDETEIG